MGGRHGGKRTLSHRSTESSWAGCPSSTCTPTLLTNMSIWPPWASQQASFHQPRGSSAKPHWKVPASKFGHKNNSDETEKSIVLKSHYQRGVKRSGFGGVCGVSSWEFLCRGLLCNQRGGQKWFCALGGGCRRSTQINFSVKTHRLSIDYHPFFAYWGCLLS